MFVTNMKSEIVTVTFLVTLRPQNVAVSEEYLDLLGGLICLVKTIRRTKQRNTYFYLNTERADRLRTEQTIRPGGLHKGNLYHVAAETSGSRKLHD